MTLPHLRRPGRGRPRRRPTTRRVTGLTAVAACACAVLVAAGSASAATRYASPIRFGAGGPAPCTDPATPCRITTALTAATSGDEVVLAAGSYRKPGVTPLNPLGEPFDDPLVVPAGVTLRGTASTARPVLNVAPDAQASAGVELGQGATIRDVGVNAKAKAGANITYSLSLGISALADRVRVTTALTDDVTQIGVSMGNGSTIRSSVSFGTGASTSTSPTAAAITAISASSTNQTATVRNVTAVSSTTNVDGVGTGVGIANGTSSGVNTITISNTIARGASVDVRVRVGSGTGTATAYVDHSNWGSQSVSAMQPGGTATLQGTGGNQNAATAAEPLFFGAATGDFRQLTGSPTIDAGVVDPNNGPLALGGALRRIGTTTDIGADEYDPANPPQVPEPEPTEPTDPEPTTPTEPGPAPGPAPDPGPGPVTPQPDRTAPVLSKLTLARSVGRKRGAALRFTLSEPATVKLAFGQPRTGRVAAGRCVRQTTKNRSRKRCTLPNVKGTLTVAGTAGANRLTFKGRLSVRRQLALGRYTLTATATDPAGNAGRPASRTFTLKR